MFSDTAYRTQEGEEDENGVESLSKKRVTPKSSMEILGQYMFR